MKLIKIVTKTGEYFFDKDKIEFKNGLKTKTQSNVSSYLINDKYVVVSSDKVVFKCDCCAEVKKTFANFKTRKHDLCISCTRKKTMKKVHENMSANDRKELNKKISEKTKQAASKIPPEKRKQMTKKMLVSIDWEKRNKKWQQTMLSKSDKEKNKMYKKVSESMKKRYQEYGPWNLSKKYSGSRFSTIDCKYYKRGIHSSNEIITIKCDNCNNDFETIRMAAARQEREHPGFIQCINCVNSAKSLKEKEVVKFLKNLGINNIIENSKSIIPPQEIDIYLPEYKLAIEFNGLYWHSEQVGVDKNYHINKTNECEKLGIHLIHVFQDDWEYKQEIVKSRLINILGLNSGRIGARKTIIREIDSKTKNTFLEKYHIQGKDKAQIKLGAYYNDELVGVMTFSKNRIFGKKAASDEWELSRFATISNTQTPGLASKMLKHFQNNYSWNQIFSFADRCWSQGGLYKALGFTKDKVTKPSYWYAYNGSSQREHRYNYRKQNLVKFDNYLVSKTEKQIMDEAGYLRVYDCGTYKFILEKQLNDC